MKHPAKRARIWIALALCLTLLTACTSGGDQKAAAFEQAKSLLASGRISDAASAFAQLTGYEDADTYAAYVEAARLRQTGDYTAAAKAFGAGSRLPEAGGRHRLRRGRYPAARGPV